MCILRGLYASRIVPLPSCDIELSPIAFAPNFGSLHYSDSKYARQVNMSKYLAA